MADKADRIGVWADVTTTLILYFPSPSPSLGVCPLPLSFVLPLASCIFSGCIPCSLSVHRLLKLTTSPLDHLSFQWSRVPQWHPSFRISTPYPLSQLIRARIKSAHKKSRSPCLTCHLLRSPQIQAYLRSASASSTLASLSKPPNPSTGFQTLKANIFARTPDF